MTLYAYLLYESKNCLIDSGSNLASFGWSTVTDTNVAHCIVEVVILKVFVVTNLRYRCKTGHAVSERRESNVALFSENFIDYCRQLGGGQTNFPCQSYG